jgi:hypothetical protein
VTAVTADRHGTAVELLRRHEVSAMLSALAEGGVHPVLLKGTALAYSVYPEPSARPRVDTDVLIRAADVEPLNDVMGRLGYSMPAAYCTGESLFCQFPLQRVDRFGLTHTVDVHWKISSQPVFAPVLEFDEVAEKSVPLPALGPAARMPNLVHSLLLACIHPVMHHRNDERAVWTYDIHLLASRMSDADFEQFTALAIARQVAAICGRQLTQARARLSTPVRESVLEKLNAPRNEPSSAYLRPNRTWRHEFSASLLAHRGWRARATFLREVMFPTASYMFASYDIAPSAATRPLLPALFLHRLGKGLWKIVSGRK